MPIDKRVSTAAEALADVADGATVLISGFGGAGFPNILIGALRERAPNNLTLVVNSATHRYSLTHELIAAGRGPDGKFVDSLRYLAEGGAPLGDPERLNRNTTLAVVATNADVNRVELQALAATSSDAIARRITPYGTLFDGDVIFAVSTRAVKAKSPMQVEAIATLVVPEAVERSVRRG